MSNNLVLLGAGVSGSGGSLTPPTVAPVLSVSADFGNPIANLEWTASNKTSTPGFGYKVEGRVDGGDWNVLVSMTTELFYDYFVPLAAGEFYEFRITPLNDAGEGPSSNTAGVILPGESNRLLLNAGGFFQLNAGGSILING